MPVRRWTWSAPGWFAAGKGYSGDAEYSAVSWLIHRWGWTLVLNPDGTTTAWNKDKTKTLHSHGPPARAG